MFTTLTFDAWVILTTYSVLTTILLYNFKVCEDPVIYQGLNME